VFVNREPLLLLSWFWLAPWFVDPKQEPVPAFCIASATIAQFWVLLRVYVTGSLVSVEDTTSYSAEV